MDPKHAPLFFEGDTIKGEVQLDFAKAQTLKGLTITVRAPGFFPPTRTLANTPPFFFFCPPTKKVRAGTTAVGQEEEVFLDITKPVWTPASASESAVVGQHTFPFSITLPRDATLAPVPQAAPKSFLLPPTFSERASPAYIDYRLFVTVCRGRLRVDKQCVVLVPSVSPSSSALVSPTSKASDGDCGAQVVDELCVPPAQRGETAICVARTRVCRRRRGPWPGRGPRRVEGL